MKSSFALALSALAVCAIAGAKSPGPSTFAPVNQIAAPKDQPFGGEIHLSVDVSDTARRVIHVHETLSGITAGTVLLYPQWLPGFHAPEGPLDRLAGLRISTNSVPVLWSRDPVQVYAFRLHSPAAIKSIDIDFDYLSPTNPKAGAIEISRDLALLEWNELVLYPAGYFTRQIPVIASLTLPLDWQFGTALDAVTTNGVLTSFKRTTLETLVDSPVYAGRYFSRLDLDPDGIAAVHMDLVADRRALLAVQPEQLAAYRSLVQQAYKLFGAHHYSHYDFLYSLSDQILKNGIEHSQSSEDGGDPESFTDWDATADGRDLLPHEFTHSWNGKFRRPADLWTANYDIPMQDTLLWVYEGQTEYWGETLAARSGLWTKQQALDQLAQTAAYFDAQSGRRWRSIQDTTNDEIINPHLSQSWQDWQRFEDYYGAGALIWLDVDTLIRERSKGKRSLDDFAHGFFGINNGSFIPLTYTFDDVVKALDLVEPYDWASFLRQRLDAIGKPAPLDGLRRGGYKLIYKDTPSQLQKASEQQRKRVNLSYSIGLQINDKDQPGLVSQVMWEGPAFKANITQGAQVLAVNGVAYSAEVLKDAIRAAKNTKLPIELIVKTDDRFMVANIDFHEGLRYPQLERDGSRDALIDQIMASK